MSVSCDIASRQRAYRAPARCPTFTGAIPGIHFSHCATARGKSWRVPPAAGHAPARPPWTLRRNAPCCSSNNPSARISALRSSCTSGPSKDPCLSDRGTTQAGVRRTGTRGESQDPASTGPRWVSRGLVPRPSKTPRTPRGWTWTELNEFGHGGCASPVCEGGVL